MIIRHLLFHGALEELLLVFLAFLEEEPHDLVKVHLVTCAVVVECLVLPRSGEDGTEKSMSTNVDTLWLPLLLPPP